MFTPWLRSRRTGSVKSRSGRETNRLARLRSEIPTSMISELAPAMNAAFTDRQPLVGQPVHLSEEPLPFGVP
ncbi:hypothetical protein [Streptomyces xanthophaeus]|uniref:hypothetical protein n=1 Tax=Streptomyces xanthophaeus TaxID=67385 RepID=UPI00264798E2|nr:hypothetical protein [Streptomyces xanthophaeus]WKD31936.1 hypothetical protein KO717_08230 [Streptomyces xanthophaeus]